eukprot:15447608-Alexandrium_andersonii.AAC.1
MAGHRTALSRIAPPHLMQPRVLVQDHLCNKASCAHRHTPGPLRPSPGGWGSCPTDPLTGACNAPQRGLEPPFEERGDAGLKQPTLHPGSQETAGCLTNRLLHKYSWLTRMLATVGPVVAARKSYRPSSRVKR